MIEVQEKKELKLQDLLTFRRKMTSVQIQETIQEIEKFLKDNNIRKNGPLVTTSFSIEQRNNEQLIDMEIMVPLSQKKEDLGKYQYKRKFYLINAVYAKHKGDPNLIQKTYNFLNSYIQKKGLTPITSGYNVNIKEIKPDTPVSEMEIDIYIGVSPNIL